MLDSVGRATRTTVRSSRRRGRSTGDATHPSFSLSRAGTILLLAVCRPCSSVSRLRTALARPGRRSCPRLGLPRSAKDSGRTHTVGASPGWYPLDLPHLHPAGLESAAADSRPPIPRAAWLHGSYVIWRERAFGTQGGDHRCQAATDSRKGRVRDEPAGRMADQLFRNWFVNDAASSMRWRLAMTPVT